MDHVNAVALLSCPSDACSPPVAANGATFRSIPCRRLRGWIRLDRYAAVGRPCQLEYRIRFGL